MSKKVTLATSLRNECISLQREIEARACITAQVLARSADRIEKLEAALEIIASRKQRGLSCIEVAKKALKYS